jgi:hypothetical protein
MWRAQWSILPRWEEGGGGHRVGRVQSLFSSRRNWDSPTPSCRRWVCPPLWSGGGTLACERRVGGVPIPTRGHTLWCSLYISTLWGGGGDGRPWTISCSDRSELIYSTLQPFLHFGVLLFQSLYIVHMNIFLYIDFRVQASRQGFTGFLSNVTSCKKKNCDFHKVQDCTNCSIPLTVGMRSRLLILALWLQSLETC